MRWGVDPAAGGNGRSISADDDAGAYEEPRPMSTTTPKRPTPPGEDAERQGPSPWGLLLLVALVALVATGHWALVVAVLGLALLIFVHELGHFLAAKAFHMRVERFYIGFPPAVVKRTLRGDRVRHRRDPARRLLQDLGHDPRGEAARRRRAPGLLEQARVAAQHHHRRRSLHELRRGAR